MTAYRDTTNSMATAKDYHDSDYDYYANKSITLNNKWFTTYFGFEFSKNFKKEIK